jgi:basic membrane lipoprotein Med (substrate-binding protein (PBP1-ABC) superfamily)
MLLRWLSLPVRSRRLVVLADNCYEDLARKHFATAVPTGTDVVLFQSRITDLPIHTFRFSYYGAAYMMGLFASIECHTAAVLIGNSTNSTNIDASQGFTDGFTSQGGTIAAYRSLSDGPEGYAMANEAYRITGELQEMGVDYMFPVAGGANQGVYRFLRSHTEGAQLIQTAGVDVDMSAFYSLVTASLIIRSDLFIKRCISEWLLRHELPKHEAYSFGSDYVYIQPTDAARSDYSDLLKNKGEQVIALEVLYEQSHE